jgi:hypothetical protein
VNAKDALSQPAHRFCNRPGAGVDFGVIHPRVSQALNIPVWPLRLQIGLPGPAGFGKAHIESAPGRLSKLRSLGFTTVEAFVEAVCQNYHRVCDANEETKKGDKISIVFRYLGHDLTLVMRRNPLGFWSVTTGLPYRVHRRPILWDQTQASGSESPP